jgi:hypothetical protein
LKMSSFDAEYNSASSTTTFRASTSLGVNISEIYLRQKPVFRAKSPFLPDAPLPWKHHHSTQNLILYPAQPFLEWAQIQQWIFARNTRVCC